MNEIKDSVDKRDDETKNQNKEIVDTQKNVLEEVGKSNKDFGDVGEKVCQLHEKVSDGIKYEEKDFERLNANEFEEKEYIAE